MREKGSLVYVETMAPGIAGMTPNSPHKQHRGLSEAALGRAAFASLSLPICIPNNTPDARLALVLLALLPALPAPQ